MAIPIKPVPILSGQIAEDFIIEAEENEKLPRHQLSEDAKTRVRKMLRQIDEYVPSWRRMK